LFVQSDLMSSVFKPESFDLIYSGGVLHHTPNTRRAFDEVVNALRPGGRIFVWLYWKVPGRATAVRSAVRRAISPFRSGPSARLQSLGLRRARCAAATV
jgi:SAM-dependent methyltransferase